MEVNDELFYRFESLCFEVSYWVIDYYLMNEKYISMHLNNIFMIDVDEYIKQITFIHIVDANSYLLTTNDTLGHTLV